MASISIALLILSPQCYYNASMKLLENDFFLKNLWWIVLLLVVFLGGLILAFSLFRQTKKEKAKPSIDVNENLVAIGGKENIEEHQLEGSRIVLKLKDYGKVDREKLKEAGAIGFIMKSDKLTIVFKEKAEEVYHAFFHE